MWTVNLHNEKGERYFTKQICTRNQTVPLKSASFLSLTAHGAGETLTGHRPWPGRLEGRPDTPTFGWPGNRPMNAQISGTTNKLISLRKYTKKYRKSIAHAQNIFWATVLTRGETTDIGTRGKITIFLAILCIFCCCILTLVHYKVKLDSEGLFPFVPMRKMTGSKEMCLNNCWNFKVNFSLQNPLHLEDTTHLCSFAKSSSANYLLYTRATCAQNQWTVM